LSNRKRAEWLMSSTREFNSFERIFLSSNYGAAAERVKSHMFHLDVNRIESRGATPLVQCVSYYPARSDEQLRQKREIINTLIRGGARVNDRCSADHDECTALHVAAYEANVDIVRDLLNVGADPTLKDANGATPAETARRLVDGEADRAKRALLGKCVDLLTRHEERSRQRASNLTPQKKSALINSVLNRAQRVNSADAALLEKRETPLKTRFASVSSSPQGRPPISPRTITTPKRKFESNLFSSSSSSSTNSSGSSSPLNWTLKDVTNKSERTRKVTIKSPVKDTGTQTPREVECQTDLTSSPPPTTPPRSKAKTPKNVETAKKIAAKIDLDEMAAFIEQIAKDQQNQPVVDKSFKEIVSEKRREKGETNNELWGYFDSSIRLPSLDETKVVAEPKLKIQLETIDSVAPKVLVEVPEIDYQNNETCVIGDLSEEDDGQAAPLSPVLEEEESEVTKEEEKMVDNVVDITPFPSSIINLVSLPQNPSIPPQQQLQPAAPLSPVDEEETEELPDETTSEGESAESFKFDFSVDDSVSFRSVPNESIQSVSFDDYDKRVNELDVDQLRSRLKEFQVHMPPLHNQKLIDKFRQRLINLMKETKHGTIYSSQLINEMKNYPFQRNEDIQTKFQALQDKGKKNYYTYILCDPRLLNNLQKRASKLTNKEIIATFVKSIFYVGKGCKNRSNHHLVETFKKTEQKEAMSEKQQRIAAILNSPVPDSNGQKYGLVIQQDSQQLTNQKALMQEAAIINAIGLDNLTNVKKEKFAEKSWKLEEICTFGAVTISNGLKTYLLHPENFIYPT